MAPKIPAAPKYLLPPDNSSDIDTGCAAFGGTCINVFNLLSKVERDFVSLDESFAEICRDFPRSVLLALAVPRVDAILKFFCSKYKY